MFSVDSTNREHAGRIIAGWRSAPDLVDAARVTAARTEVAARTQEIIVDLVALEFIDSVMNVVDFAGISV